MHSMLPSAVNTTQVPYAEETAEEEAPSMPPVEAEQPAGDLVGHLIKIEEEEQKSLQAATNALGGLSTHETGKFLR